MSRVGTRSGTPPISRSKARPGRPSRTKATSVLVPPMSKVAIASKPAWAAIHAAPATPALGPESAVRTGTRAASSTDIVPPLDWLMYGAAGMPSASTRRRNARTYALMRGAR
jgi:hypothetical protein